jgi:hypothetical protein
MHYHEPTGLVLIGTRPDFGQLGGAISAYGPESDRLVSVDRHVVPDQTVNAVTSLGEDVFPEARERTVEHEMDDLGGEDAWHNFPQVAVDAEGALYVGREKDTRRTFPSRVTRTLGSTMVRSAGPFMPLGGVLPTPCQWNTATTGALPSRSDRSR